MAIILPPHLQPSAAPLHKTVWLKTRAGVQISMPFTLQDEQGRDSAAEYLQHVYEALREKLAEPVLSTPKSAFGPTLDTLKQQILFIASFHDNMFGTFNPQSALPEQERADFIELFLLAVASVIPGNEIHIDLARGQVTSNGN